MSNRWEIMLHAATPKKAVEKVVKPTQADTNDKCRFCPLQFSVEYGNFGNLVWCTISAKNQSWNSTSNLGHEHRTLSCNIDVLRMHFRTFACKVGQQESTFNLKDQALILRRFYRVRNFEFTLKQMPCNTEHPI